MLIAIEDDISKYAYKRLKDEKNQVEQIKDIAKEMHDAYNDYIKNNEKVIELLNQIRVSLSMSRAV